jgi:hypothetical protein
MNRPDRAAGGTRKSESTARVEHLKLRRPRGYSVRT